MVDVAPTLAALLGASLPASTQGQVRVDMLNLGANAAGLAAAVQAQQTRLLEAYYKAIGEKGPIPGGAQAAEYQVALEAARESRLERERLPRILLSLASGVDAATCSGGRSPRLGWMLFGALVYILIFNLRYAVLDGRTYSLSSVSGLMDMILYCAVTAAIALAAGWLGSGSGPAFLQAGRASPQNTLGFVFMTVSC